MKRKIILLVLLILAISFILYLDRYRHIVEDSKVIYKLEGDKWTQVTDIAQIKEGTYVFIR